MEFNPANTAVLPGLRASLSHRNNFSNALHGTSFLADYYDYKFLNGGFGLSMNAIRLDNSSFSKEEVGLLYGKRLPVSQDFIFQIGVKAAYIRKQVEVAQQLNAFRYIGGFGPSAGSLYKTENQYFDYSAGGIALFNVRRTPVKMLATNKIGVGVAHLSAPKEVWFENSTQRLALKTNIHWTSKFNVWFKNHYGEKFFIMPGLLYELGNPLEFFSLDSLSLKTFTYGMNLEISPFTKKDMKFTGGFWVRDNQAGSAITQEPLYVNGAISPESYVFLLGVQKYFGRNKRNVRLSYSYDLPKGNSRAKGIHEISLALQIMDLALPSKTRTWNYIKHPADRFFYMGPSVARGAAYPSFGWGASGSGGSSSSKWTSEEFEPGLLTATEINDFSKWNLWEDVRDSALNSYKDMWKVYPKERYSVQLKSSDNRPVVNALVLLKNSSGETLWQAKSDNTGKAELWQNVFVGNTDSATNIVVEYENEEYAFDNPKQFHDGINTYSLPIEFSASNLLEIAFMVDATGSMGDELLFLKSDLVDIMDKTKERFSNMELRLGSVYYGGDMPEGGVMSEPLTKNLTSATDYIKEREMMQGGDEVVEKAFAESLDKLGWSNNARTRLLFFVLDEQPLTNNKVVKEMNHCIEKAAEMGIRVIPIIGSAETMRNAQSMEYLMRSVALATNGTYVALTDHSNIGDKHATPTTDEFDVELLNALVKRLIYQYTYIPNFNDSLATSDVSDTTYFSNSPVIAHVVVDSAGAKTTWLHKEDSSSLKQDISAKLEKDFKDEYLEDEEDIIEDTTANKIAKEDSSEFKKIEIKFYPNPTNGPVTVQIDGELRNLYLFDFSGKLISRYDVSETSEIELDLSSFTMGVYFLKFEDNGKWYSAKIILRE